MYREYGQVVAVTNRSLTERPFLEQICRVCEMHPDALILREKDLSEKEYEELAKEVMAICAEYKIPCILHTFWRVAEKLKCDTVHLPLPILRQFVLEKQNQKNQKYRESQNLSIPESQREIIQKIGTSVHSTEQAQEAQELGASYVTAGHIYATDCKKGLQPRGLDFLRQVCAAVDLPVYAIGGIKFDETQWMSLKECGAAGGCIMSGMMKV